MKNKIITLLISLLVISYLVFHAFEFKLRITSPYWPVLAKNGIGLTIILLPLFLKSKWKYRFGFSAAMLLCLMFLIPKLGIWNISLNQYVSKNHIKYEKFINANQHVFDKDISYLSCRNKILVTKPVLKTIDFENEICKTFTSLDVTEVFINKDQSKFLFSMHRFIDNGFGLMYSTSNFRNEEFFKERVGGLELTSVYKVQENWYYVSFT